MIYGTYDHGYLTPPDPDETGPTDIWEKADEKYEEQQALLYDHDKEVARNKRNPNY